MTLMRRKLYMEMNKMNRDIDTAVDRAHRWRILAENLQRRYSASRYPAWRRRGY